MQNKRGRSEEKCYSLSGREMQYEEITISNLCLRLVSGGFHIARSLFPSTCDPCESEPSPEVWGSGRHAMIAK
jgi:hypothetical protein